MVKAANGKICLTGSWGSGLSVPAWRHSLAIIKRTHEEEGNILGYFKYDSGVIGVFIKDAAILKFIRSSGVLDLTYISLQEHLFSTLCYVMSCQ